MPPKKSPLSTKEKEEWVVIDPPSAPKKPRLSATEKKRKREEDLFNFPDETSPLKRTRRVVEVLRRIVEQSPLDTCIQECKQWMQPDKFFCLSTYARIFRQDMKAVFHAADPMFELQAPLPSQGPTTVSSDLDDEEESQVQTPNLSPDSPL